MVRHDDRSLTKTYIWAAPQSMTWHESSHNEIASACLIWQGILIGVTDRASRDR